MHSKTQEAALRKNPDIVVATPGRLVDHLHNAPSFNLQTVEVLVLDEADRYKLTAQVPLEFIGVDLVLEIFSVFTVQTIICT